VRLLRIAPSKHGLTNEEAPLEVKVPNAQTRAAMEASRAMMAARQTPHATPASPLPTNSLLILKKNSNQ